MNLKKISMLSLTLCSMLVLSGCKEEGTKASEKAGVNAQAKGLSDIQKADLGLKASDVKVLNVSQITNKSNEDISQNNWGLVTADKVLGWVNDWTSNKPEHIEGKLFIMQVGKVLAKDDAHNYIKHDGVNVFTFDRTAGCTDTGSFRNDGNSNMPKPVFAGNEMDGAFWAYNINPNKDMLLIVLGEEDGSDLVAGVTRMWYTMKYWGMNSKNIAIMDGSAIYNFHPANNPKIASLDDIFVANESVMPMNGTHSIKEVKKDATILQISMNEMMNKVKTFDSEKDVIIDARSTSEYAGTSKSKNETLTCGTSGTSNCLAAFEGHIKNAKNIPNNTLIVNTDQTIDINGDGKVDSKDASYKYKSLTELKTMFANAGYSEDKTIYTYCRTGTKASMTTFIANEVLGYKTRMFDGSWIQWGKMANVKNKDGVVNLASDSRLRTDTTEYSENITPRTDSTMVNPIYGLDETYTGSSKIILEDKIYKFSAAVAAKFAQLTK